ncbi:MAG: HEPN domain-containing protein [Candidatus Methylomirabilia bacterium]
MELADEDLVMAEFALSRRIVRQACFHSQQAVEKALNGLLDARLGTHPKSHSLEQLLLYDGRVREELRTWRTQCQDLDLFYIPTRYVDALPGLLPSGEPTQEDAHGALRDAKAMVAEIREKMGGTK